MAGLEGLTPMIYHEKQQKDSMLCAQHALNSLMQGSYFTAPDLSEIAQQLDRLEASYDNANTGTKSTNMDDTGFFSVQVLEEALEIWGLTLKRWRSEDMRPYNAVPHTQLAFILNLHQHWFTLRRFGKATTMPATESDQSDSVPGVDHGDGHWYNLNSFLASPEWISRTYLGMVLQQAETEGYSVFAVCQADPSQPLALPRTTADRLASQLEVSSASSSRLTSKNLPGGGNMQNTTKTSSIFSPNASNVVQGLEGEDMELQAALQASLMTAGPSPSLSTPRKSDPTLSNIATIEGPREQHKVALKEKYDKEIPGPFSSDSTMMARALRSRGEQEEEEMIRQALKESRELLQAKTTPGSNSAASKRTPAEEEESDDDDDEYMDVDGGDDDELMAARFIQMKSSLAPEPPHLAGPSTSAIHAPGFSPPQNRFQGSDLLSSYMDETFFAGALPSDLADSLGSGISTHNQPTRYLDDEDADLQAALKASLEDAPEGFVVPISPAIRMTGSRSPIGGADNSSQPVSPPEAPKNNEEGEEVGDNETEGEDEEIARSRELADEARRKQEMRLARLARFGS